MALSTEEEALRIQQHPGIYFADEPSGRTAKIGGTALGVWEVLRDFVRDNDPERVRTAMPQLSEAQITAALKYYRHYSEDIRHEVEANASWTPERFEQEHPGLVRFVTVKV